jgi:hypothetical protein
MDIRATIRMIGRLAAMAVHIPMPCFTTLARIIAAF